MKVYLHYEHDNDSSKNYTIKLTLPKTWKKGPFKQLQDVLVDNYNTKHLEAHKDLSKIDTNDYHLEKKDNTTLPIDGIVCDFAKNADDFYLRKGKAKTLVDLGLKEPEPIETKRNFKKRTLPLTENEKRAQKERDINEKFKKGEEDDKDKGELLQCKNFGCQKKYKESQNHSKACQHHIKPPIFHETRKYWACCPEKIAWDWDSFTAIPGCSMSRHKNVTEGKRFLGGTDVRLAKEEEYGPKRLDLPKKTTTGLDKLSSLRKTLTTIGVKGSIFDEARDQLKDEVTAADETIGVKVWDKVLERLVKKIENALA